MSRNPAEDKRKGLQPCNLVIEARDDSLAGDPRCRSLRVRGLAFDSSLGSAREDHRPGVDRTGGRPGGDGPVLGPPVPRVIGRLLPGWFTHLPDQTQYNRRLRRLTPYITTVQLQVAELIAEGEVRLADGKSWPTSESPRASTPPASPRAARSSAAWPTWPPSRSRARR